MTTNLDASLIAYVVRHKALSEVQQAGVSLDDFVDEFRTVWRYILKCARDQATIPSSAMLKNRFPDCHLPRVSSTDLPLLVHGIKERTKYINVLTVLNSAASDLNSPEDTLEVIQRLQGELNNIAFTGTGKSHLVDLFDRETNKRMLEDLKGRAAGKAQGIPTGLKRVDDIVGGLRRQQMVTVMGRSGIGKSWIDLLLVANAVMAGHKVILYPLEMSLQETAFRLYTLFSQRMFGVSRVLKNYDLTLGKTDRRQVVRFMNALEDKFAGSLYVADVASLADPYTNERIEAEVDIHQPDMFWVDYITLLKAPGGRTVSDDGGWQAVRMLSQGIKNTAMRRNCVGGCSAQVNREALKANVFLPRLEHIAYGDSIGQDADLVFSLNRKKDLMYYALVKNRGGPEIGQTKMKFDVNIGILEEVSRDAEDQEDDDDADDD